MVVAIGVAGLAVSAYSSMSASDSADQASQNQQNAANKQAQVAQNQLDFGKQQYADYQKTFQPGLDQMGQLASQEVRPDYGAINSDIAASFDSSEGINTRNMERYGVKPTDGAMAESQTQYGLGRAMGQVNADNTARAGAANEQFNRLASFENIGTKSQALADDTTNKGYGSLGSAYGNQMGMYGGQAAAYGQAAAAGANAAGGFASMAMNGAGNGGLASMFGPGTI